MNHKASTDQAEARNDKRRNQRLSLAAHILNANIISWEREAFLSSRKAVLRSLFLADEMLSAVDEFPEGSIQVTDI